MKSEASPATPCAACHDGQPLGFDFSMAFQPIVDTRAKQVFAYEALVRGTDGEDAATVLARMDAQNLYRFDQECRIKAVTLAARLGVECHLSINFLPNAVYQPANCLRATLAAARRVGFPADKLMFEVVEHEQSLDRAHLKNIFEEYRRQGFLTAMDDFGAGYSGLLQLADFRPDLIKVDMDLVRGIDGDQVRQVIVRHTLAMCRELGVAVIVEGVETIGEWQTLEGMGAHLFQGFLFARPAFERLPEVYWPAASHPNG